MSISANVLKSYNDMKFAVNHRNKFEIHGYIEI